MKCLSLQGLSRSYRLTAKVAHATPRYGASLTRRERGQRELVWKGLWMSWSQRTRWIDLRSNRWLRWGPFFWDVPAVGGFVRRSACSSLAIGDTAKQMSYCTVLLPINDQSRKSFEDLLFSLNMGACVGKGSSKTLGVDSKEATSFQKRSRDSAFFFDRGRGVSRP